MIHKNNKGTKRIKMIQKVKEIEKIINSGRYRINTTYREQYDNDKAKKMNDDYLEEWIKTMELFMEEIKMGKILR